MDSLGDFEHNTNVALLGKTVMSADVNGHGVCIVFTDGTTFDYSASDGGERRAEP